MRKIKEVLRLHQRGFSNEQVSVCAQVVVSPT